jgi:hypothetical protein
MNWPQKVIKIFLSSSSSDSPFCPLRHSPWGHVPLQTLLANWREFPSHFQQQIPKFQEIFFFTFNPIPKLSSKMFWPFSSILAQFLLLFTVLAIFFPSPTNSLPPQIHSSQSMAEKRSPPAVRNPYSWMAEGEVKNCLKLGQIMNINRLTNDRPFVDPKIRIHGWPQMLRNRMANGFD